MLFLWFFETKYHDASKEHEVLKLSFINCVLQGSLKFLYKVPHGIFSFANTVSGASQLCHCRRAVIQSNFIYEIEP